MKPGSSEPAALDALRNALVGGLLLAFAWALPAAVLGGAVTVLEWLCLLGGAALLFAPLALAHWALTPLGPFERAAFTGLSLSGTPLLLFALLLVRGTHHRPLGSVTFALLGAAVVLFSMVFAYRCMTLEIPALQRIAWGLCRLLAVSSLVWVSTLLYTTLPACRAVLVDAGWAVALFLVVVSGKGRLSLARISTRVPFWLAICGWLLVSGIGVGLLTTRADVADAVLGPIKACGLL